MPLGKAGVRLLVRCRRYECRGCGGAWEDDLSRVAADGRRLTEAAVWWAVASVMPDAMSVRSVAMTLGCSWDRANDAVLSKGMARLINDERRLRDVLAFFDHTFSGNGPTEAINGRLEHLRGIALGFTNLGDYITRSLLHAGGFRQTIRERISQP